MSGRIPGDIVDRVKTETDIVSVISEFISLKKSGKDFKGLCPFHQEKTPSFFVIPGKGFFHCFGCGKGGNAVNFIMEHERLDYPSSLRYLADKAGIVIPRTESAGTFEDRLHIALSMAASFFEKSLFENPVGKMALEYLQSRGISMDTARLFGFGFAPPGWDNLLRAAAEKGVKVADLEAAGLVAKKQKYYDRFRNRLMAPIKTLSGKVVGFGGRIMPGDDSPKYINSPETSVYKKGRILFGMDVTKNAIRDNNEAVVVEGYFDLITLYQAGIKNVVAASGTGFTDRQASLLARFCEKAVLLFDSDSAGVKAAFRASGVLYNAGLEPSLVMLPKGTDPDSFIRENGRSELSRLISESVDIIGFIQGGLKGRFSDQTLTRQKRIVAALSELMSPIEDNLTRDLLSKKMFDRLDIDIKTLGIIGETRKSPEPSRENEVVAGRDKFEREFLRILLSHPEFISMCSGQIDEFLFTESSNAEIYRTIEEFAAEGRELSITDISEKIADSETGRRLREMAISSEPSGEFEVEFDDYLEKFRLISVRKRLDELKSLIGEAESKSDDDRLRSLTREFQNLKSEVKANDARV